MYLHGWYRDKNAWPTTLARPGGKRLPFLRSDIQRHSQYLVTSWGPSNITGWSAKGIASAFDFLLNKRWKRPANRSPEHNLCSIAGCWQVVANWPVKGDDHNPHADLSSVPQLWAMQFYSWQRWGAASVGFSGQPAALWLALIPWFATTQTVSCGQCCLPVTDPNRKWTSEESYQTAHKLSASSCFCQVQLQECVLGKSVCLDRVRMFLADCYVVKLLIQSADFVNLATPCWMLSGRSICHIRKLVDFSHADLTVSWSSCWCAICQINDYPFQFVSELAWSHCQS